jgi:molybdopterin-guanine dinucleotide biosynthesis protein A
MGKPKAWLPFGDEFMLQRVVRILREVVEPVGVVAAPGQDVPPLPPEVRIVRDEIEGRGPLGGLAAGLAALEGEADAVHLSSCDVPLLQAEFVCRVVEMLHLPSPTADSAGAVGGGEGGGASPPGEESQLAGSEPSPLTRSLRSLPSPQRGEGKTFAAAVPFVAGRLHPLAAAYHLSVLPVVREMLAARNFRMTDLLSAIPSRIITAEELVYTDPQFLSLRNLNTPEEYAAALRTLSGP